MFLILTETLSLALKGLFSYSRPFSVFLGLKTMENGNLLHFIPLQYIFIM